MVRDPYTVDVTGSTTENWRCIGCDLRVCTSIDDSVIRNTGWALTSARCIWASLRNWILLSNATGDRRRRGFNVCWPHQSNNFTSESADPMFISILRMGQAFVCVGFIHFRFVFFCNAGKFVVYLIIICGDKWHRVWCSTGALIVRGESQHVTFHRCHRCPTVALIQVINDLHSPLSPRALFCVSFVRLFVFVSFLDITHMT